MQESTPPYFQSIRGSPERDDVIEQKGSVLRVDPLAIQGEGSHREAVTIARRRRAK